ncbi:PAS domain S-box protein [Rhodocytophaga rosea]|uniref:PAS domain S-box protein n=1 Tax=Rhodocytophaga rosea TaxID=2704465 RepID=A0A6C0GQ85_9BACT|nr:PAS domain S-box protein [Rhodocytophaga rosea]QHT69773.1 PAS domain S-box protein [Rhodocytophaga rosea]
MGNVFTLSFYFDLGVATATSRYTQEKIRSANRLALTISSICLLCGIFACISSSKLGVLLMCVSVIYASLPLLHLLGVSTLMRLCSAVVLPLTIYVVHSSIATSVQMPLPGFTLIQLAALPFPWILFSYKEKSKLLPVVVMVVSLLFLAQQPVNILGISMDKSLLLSAGFNYFTYGVAIVLLCTGLFMLQRENLIFQAQSQQMASSMQGQEAAFKETQDKLNTYITEIEQSQQANQQRQWASDGIALFAEILRRQDTTDLYDTLIGQLVKYLKANQGGLFLIKEEEGNSFLELKACYAYDRKKYHKKQIQIGEGLLGQCMLEQDIIHLTEIPNDYINITSGLGKANPTTILILPLKSNESMEGIIELASFRIFESFEIEFLEKLCESIASSVGSVKIHQRTRELLDQFQMQSEEMHAQKEEMRQNIEELEATQEEMRRIQERLQRKDEESQQMVAELTGIRNELETQLTEKLSEAEGQKARMEVFLKTATDAILFMDDQACITACNAATETMFSYKAVDLTGKSIAQLLQLPAEANLIQHLQENIKTKRSNWIEYNGKNKMYGSIIPVELCLTEGQVNEETIFVMMIRDISKRKKTDNEAQKTIGKFQELQKAMQESLQKMNALKVQLKEKEDLLALKEEEIKTLKN